MQEDAGEWGRATKRIERDAQSKMQPLSLIFSLPILVFLMTFLLSLSDMMLVCQLPPPPGWPPALLHLRARGFAYLERWVGRCQLGQLSWGVSNGVLVNQLGSVMFANLHGVNSPTLVSFKL